MPVQGPHIILVARALKGNKGPRGPVRHLCQRSTNAQQTIYVSLLSFSSPGKDLFELNGKVYLIVTDYYSRWLEIKELCNETSQFVIQALKELFAIHGIPDLIISDNGPQYSADSFHEFATKYGFLHTTSSPRYPQANGEVERAVRTAKSLLRKNDEIYSALLTYRSTPLQNGLSLSELLMEHRLRTQLPIHPKNLYPNVQLKEHQNSLFPKGPVIK